MSWHCRPSAANLWNEFRCAMKRIWILLASLFLVAILLILVAARDSGGTPTIPRFVPGAPASVGPFTWDHYNWNTKAPFNGGKVWMWTVGPGRNDGYVSLCYLDHPAILDELLHGG